MWYVGILWLTGLLVACFFYVLQYKKFAIYLSAALWALFLLFVVSLVQNWFFDQGVRRSYYRFYAYDENKIRVVTDKNFLFYEEGHTASYNLNSNYGVAHRILLIPESKTVPVGYQFQGELLIELYDDAELLHSTIINTPMHLLRDTDNDDFKNYWAYLGCTGLHPTSVFAFELGEIPFSIIRPRRGKLENIEIKITVLKRDEKLKQYCDKATLIIIPDLRL